ncbi:MAG: GNAT family protein [Burkholderiaceae bacterium]
MTAPDTLLPYPPEPVTLRGEVVELRPLAGDDAPGLARAVDDGRLWELWYTAVPPPDAVPGWIEQALALQARGAALPFAVVDRASGRIVGSTRYMNIETELRRLEIGTTFYAASVQRGPLNTEAKLLLLTHAFERLGCVAVEFRTHFMNHPSRQAIAKLGARQDGILRQHRLLPDGTRRDTVVFSILDHEWPTVRRHLHFRLARLLAAAAGGAR